MLAILFMKIYLLLRQIMHSIADSLKLKKNSILVMKWSSPLAKPNQKMYKCFLEMGEFWLADILPQHLYNRIQSLATS